MIVKVCKTHGELKPEDISLRFDKRHSSEKNVTVCRICQTASQNKYREKTQNKSYKKWKEKFPEKFKLSLGKYNKKRSSINVKFLTDVYVKNILIKQHGWKPEEITPWMIELKRSIIKIRRNIREKNDNERM